MWSFVPIPHFERFREDRGVARRPSPVNREAVLYVLAFVGVIAAGAWFIVPRLAPRPVPRVPEVGPSFDVGPTEGDPVGPLAAVPDAPTYSWVEVEVASPKGALRGPLHEVFGADVQPLADPEAGLQRLRVRAVEPLVSFGAVGHQWVHRPATALRDDERIVLPLAAPPLVVRVREVDGTPAADVPVRIRPEVPGVTYRTDEGGALVLAHLSPGFVLLDFNTAERSGPVMRLRAGRDRDVTVTLDPAWVVRGRLVDPKGEPVARGRVVVFGPGGRLGVDTVSDAQGRFAWRGPAVARAALCARAAGWTSRRVALTPRAVGPLALDVGDLEFDTPSAQLEGHVDALTITPDAHITVEPAVAALVREVFGSGHALDVPRKAPVQPDGTFALADIDANLPLRVRVRGTGVPLDQLVVGEPGTVMQVDLFPPHGHTLHGRVVDADGSPREGVQLLVSAQPRDGNVKRPGDRTTVTGVDGRFRVLGIEERAVFVRAYVPGRRSLLRKVDLPAEGGVTLPLEPALRDDTRRVRGRVLTPGGAPAPGVTVRAAGIQTRTDADGAFVLEGVESVAPRVDLFFGYEPGAVPDTVDVKWQTLSNVISIEPGGPPVSLKLPAAGQLTMRMVDGIDERPITFVHVLALAGKDRRVVIDRGFAARDGHLTMTGLVAEGLHVFAYTHDRRWSGTATVRPGVATDLGTLAMDHGVRIDGTVKDPQGAPIAGAHIGAFDEGWQRAADPAYERELLFRNARTGEDGTFAISGFARRHYLGTFIEAVDLAAWAPNRAPAAARVDVSAATTGEAVPCDIELVRGVFLSLDLQAARPPDATAPSRPIHGAIVDVEFARDGSGLLELWHWGMLQGPVASTDDWVRASTHLLFEARSEDGYLLGPLRAGPYDVWVSHPAFVPLRQGLTVMDDEMPGSGAFQRKLLGRTSHFILELEPRGATR